MAMQTLNIPETPLNFEKFKKSPKKHRNLKSCWAFLLSIFIYISIFYIFDLSPSTLFYTTKFWFFISNTLILIIAADFGAFSSSKEHDFEDYVKNITKPSKSIIVSFEAHQYVKTVEKTTLNHLENQEIDEKPQEKIINIVPSTSNDHKDHQIEEYKPEILTIKEKNEVPENKNERIEKNKQEMMIATETGNGLRRRRVKKKRAAKCARSNSDKTAIMAAVAAEEEENEEKYVLQRTLSERHDHEEPLTVDHENEFSRMSNEELNNRVEEFIRRFNREIRLQAERSQHDH